MTTQKRLGKGIGSLLSNRHAQDNEAGDGRLWVPVGELQANPEQPRVALDKSVERLSESLRKHGMMQPIVVTRDAQGQYQILAGERRWRAAQLAQMKSVPVVLREGNLSGEEMLELALIENIQREDLDAIEKAKGCSRLAGTYGLTQEEIAERLGYQRSTVANLVRLLELPEHIQEDVSRETISAGHARALLKLQGAEVQDQAWREVRGGGHSVRDTEQLCARLAKGERPPKHKENVRKPAWANELQEKLSRHLGAKAELKLHARGGGKLVLHFQEVDQLDRLTQNLGLRDEVSELLEE